MYRRETTPPAADPKRLTLKFLIAIPLLESSATHSKESPLTFSNRDYITVFHFKSRLSLARQFLPCTPCICRAASDRSALLSSAFPVLTTLSGYGIYPSAG